MRGSVRRFRVIAGVAGIVLALTATIAIGLLLSRRFSEPDQTALDRGASDARADGDGGPSDATVPAPRSRWLWANSSGRCRLVDGNLQCCGLGTADGLRVSSVNSAWMGGGAVCYTNLGGGGACLTGYRRPDGTFERQIIPSQTVAVTAVFGNGGLCVLTVSGTVECLSDGEWTVVFDRAEALDASGTMFVLASGDIWCWRDHDQTCSHTPATKLTGVGDIVAVETSLSGYVCGLRRSGTVLCWGGPPAQLAPPEGSLRTPAPVSEIPPLAWLRRVGGDAFCGGRGGPPSDTLQCWGYGPAPLLELTGGYVGDEAAGVDDSFLRGRTFRLERPVVDVTGSHTLGCYVDSEGIETCVTNIEPRRLRCGATLLPHLFDAHLDSISQ